MFGSVGKSQPINTDLAKAQKALELQKLDAISGTMTSISDNLKLSQEALQKTQQAFSSGSAFNQSMAIGSLSKQLGSTLRNSYKLQSEIGSTFSENAITASSKASSTIEGIAKVTDVAGAFTELASAQSEATKDFYEMQKVLMDPAASVTAKIAASAKATKSASSFITKQNSFLKTLTPAEKAILAESDEFQALTQPHKSAPLAFLSKVTESKAMQKALYAAEVGGSSAGFVLSAISLPKLVTGTKDRYAEMVKALENPNATDQQKIDSIAETARAGAGSVYAVKGIGDSFTGLVTALKKSDRLAPLIAKAEGSSFVNNSLVAFSKTTIGKIVNFLLPIADVGIAMADSVKAYETYQNKDATFSQKARATLDVGFDLIKVLTYMLPQTRAMRYAYMGASFAQMGLATWDIATAATDLIKNSDLDIDQIEATAISFEQKIKNGVLNLIDRIFGDKDATPTQAPNGVTFG